MIEGISNVVQSFAVARSRGDSRDDVAIRADAFYPRTDCFALRLRAQWCRNDRRATRFLLPDPRRLPDNAQEIGGFQASAADEGTIYLRLLH